MSRKRARSLTPTPIPSARRRKQTVAGSISEVAGAVNGIKEALLEEAPIPIAASLDDLPPSPIRRRQGIQMVQSLKHWTPRTKTRIIGLLGKPKNTYVSDTLLVVDEDLREGYVNAAVKELESEKQ